MVAVVVGSVDYGDADRIVRLLSAEEGRTAVMARKARSSRKRFGGAFDIGNLVDVQRGRKRTSLPSVSGVDILGAPRHARTDLDRIALLAYGCEVCSALAPEHHEAEKLFLLLEAWLHVLEGEATPGAASRIALEAKALTFAGLTPALVRCTRCGEPLDEAVHWEHQAGGALHARCGAGIQLDRQALVLVEALRRTPLAESPGTEVPHEVLWLLSDFLRYQLGRDLKSRALLEQLDSPR